VAVGRLVRRVRAAGGGCERRGSKDEKSLGTHPALRSARAAMTAFPNPRGAGMASKADFNEDEWTRLKRAPFIAGLAISLADPGGPIEAVKETAATLKSVVAAADGGGHGDLVQAIA